jgi:hypothetical protein
MLRGLVLILLVLPTTASAQAGEKLAAGSEGKLAIPGCSFSCVLYVPSDYVPSARMPLILFMHGSGGSPTTWPFKDATAGKGYLIAGLSYGAFPDGGAGGIKTDPPSCLAMIKFIDQVRAEIDKLYGVDQKHVYLTGLSMGGWGVNFYGFNKDARGRYRGYAILAAGPRKETDFSIPRGLPVLVLNGEKDPNLAVAKEGVGPLGNAGAVVKQVILPGQPHVPATESLTQPLKSWLTGIEEMDARERALAAVRWQSGELTGAPASGAVAGEALGKYLAQQSSISTAEADRPIILFCHSRQEGKNGELTPQARESASVEEEVFSFPSAVATPAVGRHFSCLRIDVSAIDPKRNSLINQANVPQVILLSKDRTVAAILKGKSKLSDKEVAGEMKKLLEEAAQDEVARRISSWEPVLKDLRELRKKIRSKNETITKIRETPAKDPKVRDQTIEREQKLLEELIKQQEALREKLSE